MSDLYTVNDIFKNWKTAGIFSTMSANYSVPWDKTVAKFLDWAYHGNRSGDKFVAPLVMEVLEEDGTITDDNITTLCGVAFMKYGSNWERLFKADTSEYNPIENYSMTEEGTDTQEGTNTHTGTGSDTVTHNTTNKTDTTATGESDETTGTTGTSDTSRTVYGFDSPNGRDSDKETRTDDNTTTRNGSNTATGSQTVTNTGTDKTDTQTNATDAHTATNKHSFKRSGNIGVTTSAQMIEQEHKLWGDWSIYEQIFKDIDDIFTIGVFADKADPNGRYVIVKQYVLPQADSSKIGGVKVVPASDSQTDFIGITPDGFLKYSSVTGDNVKSVNGKTGIVLLDAADVDGVSNEVFDAYAATIDKAIGVTIPQEIEQVKKDIEQSGYYSDNNPPPYPVTSIFGTGGDVYKKVPESCYRVVNGTLDGITIYDNRVGGIMVLADLSDYIGHMIEFRAYYDYAYPMSLWHQARGTLNEGVALSDVDLSTKGQFTLTSYYANNYTTGREGVRIWRQIPKEAEPFIISAIVWQSSGVIQYPDLMYVDLYVID